MAKVRTFEDKISPAGTFSGDWVTRIEEKDGTVSRGRGHTAEQSRQRAEDDYDDKHRDKK
jgi:hypothetical protein